VRVLHVDSGREFRGGQNQVRLLARELDRKLASSSGSSRGAASEWRPAAADGIACGEIPWASARTAAWWRLS